MAASSTGGTPTASTIVSSVAGGVVGGAIVMAIVGAVRAQMVKTT